MIIIIDREDSSIVFINIQQKKKRKIASQLIIEQYSHLLFEIKNLKYFRDFN